MNKLASTQDKHTVFVYSRREIATAVEAGNFHNYGTPFSLISIRGIDCKPVIDNQEELGSWCTGLLKLEFDDINSEDSGFTEEIAADVLSFIKNTYTRTRYYIVQCDAGISRSGAVGEWLSDYLNIPYKTFKATNPRTIANTYIYTVLKKVTKDISTAPVQIDQDFDILCYETKANYDKDYFPILDETVHGVAVAKNIAYNILETEYFYGVRIYHFQKNKYIFSMSKAEMLRTHRFKYSRQPTITTHSF